MHIDDATQLLFQQVPLLRHTELSITELGTDAVQLHAPLSANGNHHGTAFGGSLSMLGIVAGWLLAFVGQGLSKPTRNIVIADSHTRYLSPLASDLIIDAQWTPADGAHYRRCLARGERAEVMIQSRAGDPEQAAICQDNRFVAVPS